MIPNYILETFLLYKTKPIYNYYKTDYKKKALLSYIIAPFKKDSLSHTNYFEARTWAEVLNDSEYQVDIVQYDNYPENLDLSKYNLVCGFGDMFKFYFGQTHTNATSIYYATGMHVCVQNQNSFQRLKDVYTSKGVWLSESTRFVEKTWTHQTSLSDVIIALGNEANADTYKKFHDNVYSLDAPFFNTQEYNSILESKKNNYEKHFLWFGSSGVIHKGLDLLLDYFKGRNDIFLHICGNVKNEAHFCDLYSEELFNEDNIFYHGFIDISSIQFKNILKQCAWTIFPSCSEGGAVSVLTVIGNGGLIPIITKETSVDTGYEIWIDDFSTKAINDSINVALSLSKYEIENMMKMNAEVVCKRNSLKMYKQNLKNIIDISDN